MFKKILLVAALTCVIAPGLSAQNYNPSPENRKAREEFRSDRFGIFIHWGIYSMMARSEWCMANDGLNYQDYENFAGGFYPSKFDAAQWAKTFKAAGARYIRFTARHHDGFSMFDSKFTDYDIMDASPFKRDILKELTDACAKEGIKVHLYYSHVDWHRLDYPLGSNGRNLGRPTDQQDYESYYRFMNNQLTELLTGYGPISGLWFDGYWDHRRDDPPFEWKFKEQYDLIHSIQPGCLIANNHHLTAIPGEDLQTFERDLPGENTYGYIKGDIEISTEMPLETCQTMNGSWGYNIYDKNWKSSTELIRLIIRAASKGANLTINIGPQPDGQIQREALERLADIGKYMEQYGETIYDTSAGLIPQREWGVSTTKGDRLFLHIFKSADKTIFLPVEGFKILSAVKFGTAGKLNFSKCTGGYTLVLPELPAGTDYVVELKIS